MSLSQKVSEELEQEARLYMLQLLADQPGYKYNLGLLRNLISEGVFTISLAECWEVARWLADHRLVTFDGERFEKPRRDAVVNLTLAGKEVATGVQIVAGVRRPEPNEINLWPRVELPPLLPKD